MFELWIPNKKTYTVIFSTIKLMYLDNDMISFNFYLIISNN